MYERERSRMQLGLDLAAPSVWASALRAPPPGSSNLPSIAFRTPILQPAAVRRVAEVNTAFGTGMSPASGALRSLSRQHALPGVLRFGGNERPPHDWRLLMKVCAARLLVAMYAWCCSSSSMRTQEESQEPRAVYCPDESGRRVAGASCVAAAEAARPRAAAQGVSDARRRQHNMDAKPAHAGRGQAPWCDRISDQSCRKRSQLGKASKGGWVCITGQSGS